MQSIYLPFDLYSFNTRSFSLYISTGGLNRPVLFLPMGGRTVYCPVLHGLLPLSSEHLSGLSLMLTSDASLSLARE